MFDLPATWQRMLQALASGPIAWRTPEEVARALRGDLEETTDLLADLDAAGWVEVWERDEGLVVVLSPLAAERLGVRLVEFGHDAVPRWIGLGDPEPSPIRPRATRRGTKAPDLNGAVDPSPGPDLIAESAERLTAPQIGRGPPRPTWLLGIGLTPWPGPQRDPAATCPSCGTAPLGPQMYCMCCDRWGLDPCGSRLGRSQRPPSSARARDGRARRKARRVARFGRAGSSSSSGILAVISRPEVQ